MYVWRRHLRTLLIGLALCLLPSAAWAWVETSTKSHVVVLDVERDGSAVVAHEIIVQVKGGPLLGFDLNGVDSDAAPLPDATVAPADAGPRGAAAIPLLLERRDDGSLRVEVDHPKGVSRGTYVFKLRYRTNLRDRALIHQVGSSVEVRWVGPRPQDGIDSARVVFRLPPGSPPPRIADGDSEQGDESGGIFLANLRRAADKDELELVRPHVAKGEPVVWRVVASPKAFDGFVAPEPVLAGRPLPTMSNERPNERLVKLLILFGVALAYALTVLVKWRALARACQIRSAKPRALIPLPAAMRAALAGALVAGAVACATEAREPTLAGALLLAGIAFAAHVSPTPIPAPRSPGRWLALSDEDAFDVKEANLPGRWLDAGTLPGFFMFALCLTALATAAGWVFMRSPYYGLLLALGAAVLLPVFCTGRTGELPPDPARRPARLLSWLASRLRQDPSLRVVAWARMPQHGEEPDELRLLVMPRRALGGLAGIEFGLEYQGGLGGPVLLPWVMVRAREGSEASQALPHNVVWTRGRNPEERAAVLRPKLPTRGICLSLLRSVAASLTDRGRPEKRSGQPAIKLPMSGGKGSSSAKGSMVSSPAQAT